MWVPGGSEAWLKLEESFPNGFTMYAVKRPDGYDWRECNYWAHVYLMRGAIADSNIIEHYEFRDFAPLELECAMLAMREKYST
jgi:hypothetical protein